MTTLFSAFNDWMYGNKDAGPLWDNFTSQFTTIILTTITICVIGIVYNVKIRNHKEGEKLSGFLVLIDMIVSACENLVVSTMGNKHRRLTPYVMYLMMYIFINAFFSLLGFEPGTTSYTVPLSMGLITFFGIYFYGLKYQKLAFFKKYINPLELLTQFVPLLSISFRLFGNMLGGSIILGLLYAFLMGAEAKMGGAVHFSDATDNSIQYWWTGFNFMTALALPWLHLYFDLFDGGIQAVVFSMLTLAYWSEALGEEEEHGSEKSIKKSLKQRNKLEARAKKAASKIAAKEAATVAA